MSVHPPTKILLKYISKYLSKSFDVTKHENISNDPQNFSSHFHFQFTPLHYLTGKIQLHFPPIELIRVVLSCG